MASSEKGGSFVRHDSVEHDDAREKVISLAQCGVYEHLKQMGEKRPLPLTQREEQDKCSEEEEEDEAEME